MLKAEGSEGHYTTMRCHICDKVGYISRNCGYVKEGRELVNKTSTESAKLAMEAFTF